MIEFDAESFLKAAAFIPELVKFLSENETCDNHRDIALYAEKLMKLRFEYGRLIGFIRMAIEALNEEPKELA